MGLIPFGSKDAKRPGTQKSWQPEAGGWQRTFTIVATTPNELIASIHDRMPAIILAERADDWLFQATDSDAVRELLVPAATGFLVGTPVSTRVNSVKNDDPACLEPRYADA